LLAVGSESPHYTASKIFPCILAARPLLAVFHERSSVIAILEETRAGEAVQFGDNKPVLAAVDEIAARLRDFLALPSDAHPPTRWEAFERYTARAMTARLAEVFDKATDRDKS
jgi:hypothetical protein